MRLMGDAVVPLSETGHLSRVQQPSRPFDVAGLIAVLALLALYLFPVLYNFVREEPVFEPLTSADTLPTVLLPASLLRDGDLYLDEYFDLATFQESEEMYYVRLAKGHIVSIYPVFAAFLAVPAFALPVLSGGIVEPWDNFYLARVTAAALAALAMGLYYALCRQELPPWKALALTLALGLGTAMWTTVSQGLHQHTASIPFLFGALIILARTEAGGGTLPWAGLLLSIATVARYNNITTLAVFALYVLFRHRRHFLPFLLLAAVPLSALLLYNALMFGSAFELSYGAQAVTGWTERWWRGLAGLMVSPAKGLLVFSPFLAFALLEGLRALRRVGTLSFSVALAAWVFTAVMAKWWAWYGGFSYGNRMLSDTLPLWGYLLIPAVRQLSGRGWALFGLAVSFAVVAHMLGLKDYGTLWHTLYDEGPEEQGWLWDVWDSPIPFYLRAYAQGLLGRAAGSAGAPVE